MRVGRSLADTRPLCTMIAPYDQISTLPDCPLLISEHCHNTDLTLNCLCAILAISRSSRNKNSGQHLVRAYCISADPPDDASSAFAPQQGRRRLLDSLACSRRHRPTVPYTHLGGSGFKAWSIPVSWNELIGRAVCECFLSLLCAGSIYFEHEITLSKSY